MAVNVKFIDNSAAEGFETQRPIRLFLSFLKEGRRGGKKKKWGEDGGMETGVEGGGRRNLY